MCSVQHFLGQKSRVWEFLNPIETDIVDVTEVWGDPANIDSRQTIHQKIPVSEVPAWLERTANDKCLLHIAWATLYEKENSYDMTADVCAQVTQAFSLHKVQEHFTTCYSWSTCSALAEESKVRAYYHGRNPLLHLAWSRKEDCSTTSALCIAKARKIAILQELLSSEFAQRLAGHELLLPFLCALLLCQESDAVQVAISQRVREVEVRTGYHVWESRWERPASGDLNSLSAKMGGCDTKTAMLFQKLDTAQELVKFVEKEAEKVFKAGYCEEGAQKELKVHLDVLVQRVKTQRMEAEFIGARVKSQLTALFHLIAQSDISLSHSMAQDSKLLALAAHSDSSSMKSLAIVNMFFLPGTYVSSLFSIPLFDWDALPDAGSVYKLAHWRPILTTYMAVTVPLTAVTFGMWGMWLYVVRVQGRRRSEEASALLRKGREKSEVEVFLEKKMSVLES